MSLIDIVILGVIAVIAWFCIRSIRKGGSCASCGSAGSCSCNSATCKWTRDLTRAKRDIEKQKRLTSSSL